MSNTADPSRIIEVGFGYLSSKVLLTAIKLEVFTKLAPRSMTGEELGAAEFSATRNLRLF